MMMKVLVGLLKADEGIFGVLGHLSRSKKRDSTISKN